MSVVNTVHKFLAEQARLPSGWFGEHVASRLLNRGNRPLNERVVAALELAPSDVVLDVGFGGGVALGLIAMQVRQGRVLGIDPSPEMVEHCRRRFRSLLDAGRLELCHAGVDDLPFADASIDKACSVNTLYFWDNPEHSLREIGRVLRPRGRLVLGINSKERLSRNPLTRHGFRIYSVDEVTTLVDAAGYDRIEVRTGKRNTRRDTVIVSAHRGLRTPRCAS
jgi:ubiquinone/menaquinone biosynthesis C-methylase UbiE